MNETPQMQADRALAEDRAARAAMRDGHDAATAARAALAAIHRDAQERAAPYLDTLARLEASKPPSPLPVLFVTRGDGVPLPDQPAAVAAFVAAATRKPRSRAEQVREALLVAFEDEPDATRRGFAKAVFMGASDAQLELVGRFLKYG